MHGEKKIDWEAAYAMGDRDKMFLLYTVSEGLCKHISDFTTHFEGTVGEDIQKLIRAGFLEDADGQLFLTERGRFVLGDLANVAQRKELKKGSWIVSTNPLHADNGIGMVQQVRGEKAKVEFRPTVFSKPPYLTVSRTLRVNELHDN